MVTAGTASRRVAYSRDSAGWRGLVLYAALLGAAALVLAMLYAAKPARADIPQGADPMTTVKAVMDQAIAVFKDRQISGTDRQKKLRTIAEQYPYLHWSLPME